MVVRSSSRPSRGRGNSRRAAHLALSDEVGRGWELAPYPRVLEPDFPTIPEAAPPAFIDDGRRPTLLSRLVRHLFGAGAPPPPAIPPKASADEAEAPAAELPEHLEEHQVLLPEGLKLPSGAAEQFLIATRFCRNPIAWELIGSPSGVTLQFAAQPEDVGHLRGQIQSVAPDAAVIRRPDFLADAWIAAVKPPGLVVDLGLSHHFTRPLRAGAALSTDPYVPLAASLSGVAEGELAVLQVIFSPAVHPWAEWITASAQDEEGRSLLPPDAVGHLRAKFSTPLYACRARVAVKAESHARQLQLLQSVMGGIAQLTDPRGNELLALDHGDWAYRAQVIDLFARTAHRAGMLVSTQELAGLVHLPGPEVRAERFLRLTRRSRPAPDAVRGDGALLGENLHHGKASPVHLALHDRLRHTLLLGGTGSGKSTLLLNLILGDIEAGRGVAVLDPHGDLINNILARIPESRMRDVVLIDPADEEFPVGLNVLSAHSELERTLLSSDLVAVFRRLSTSWGDQLHNILAQAIIAFLESPQGGTLLDLRRFLVDREFRTGFLKTVPDPEVAYFWEKEFPLLRGNPQAPILTRLNAFLRPRIIRNMVGVRGERSLDFRGVLDGRRILLARLSQGAIGEENSHLLGSLLVAKLQQAALSRQDKDAASREPFFLYLDEFHHFATPSLASMFTGVRKYGLAVTAACQSLGQIDSDVLDGALAAGVRIVFRVHEQDARKLAEGFSFFEPRDIGNLGIGEAIVRIGQADCDFNLRTRDAPPAPEGAGERIARIREASRKLWASPREELAPLPASDAPLPSQPKPEKPITPAPIPVRPAIPPSPGRGGEKHKYLQALIARMGQDRGFRASIEEVVLEGAGSVDVALTRDDLRIAVEISITNSSAYELGNVQKCLAAGFATVLLVGEDQKGVRRLEKAMKALAPEELARVRVLAPEEIPIALDELAIPAAKTKTVAGYKVKVAYARSDAPQKPMDAVREIISRSLRRKPKE